MNTRSLARESAVEGSTEWAGLGERGPGGSPGHSQPPPSNSESCQPPPALPPTGCYPPLMLLPALSLAATLSSSESSRITTQPVRSPSFNLFASSLFLAASIGGEAASERF